MSDHADLPLLKEALTELRQAWPPCWPGLDVVLKGCLNWFSGPQSLLSPQQTSMLAKMVDCARWVEGIGQTMHEKGIEPAYHNRLHIADTLVACTVLLQMQRAHEGRQPTPPTEFEWTCLLTMLVHDVGHDGRINASSYENERRSVAMFKPRLRKMGFAPQIIQKVETLVLVTEPRQAIATHRECRAKPICDFDLMALLVTESDIMASALPFPGEQLTHALSIEWASHSPGPSRQLLTPQGRLGFLQHAANFSSPASQRLGVQAVIDAQVEHLQAQIHALN